MLSFARCFMVSDFLSSASEDGCVMRRLPDLMKSLLRSVGEMPMTIQ